MKVIIDLDKSILDKVEKLGKKDNNRSRKNMLEKIIKDGVK